MHSVAGYGDLCHMHVAVYTVSQSSIVWYLYCMYCMVSVLYVLYGICTVWYMYCMVCVLYNIIMHVYCILLCVLYDIMCTV